VRAQYDVTIIGAGPAGAVAAIAFARRGARVLLAEANPKAASRFAGEWMHPPGVKVLERLGLLPLLAARGHESGQGFAVFPDDGESPIRLPYPDGAVGLSFEHQDFVEELRARADAIDDIDYVPGARVIAIEDGKVRIQHKRLGERTVATDLVVGAEGRGRSVSRSHLGLPDNSTPLSWMAGVELRDVEVPFEGYGHVILGGPGPILLYPIGPGRARACLDIPLDRCPNRRDTALLWRMFRPVLPGSLVTSFQEALEANRVVWTSIRFRPHVHHGRGRVALIGDTVGFSHPLTAAGLTLGLDDAETLAASRDVQHYRRQRERPCYVAELLSNSLYHVLSREDASIEPIRTAIYHMWGDSEAERRRTMRILITEDYRSASFAATFLRVGTGALKHLIRSSPGGDWWRQLPSVSGLLNGPGSLLQWPTAALIPKSIRAAYQSRSTPKTPIPHLRLLTGPEPTTPPAVSTPRPSETHALTGLSSAVEALADLLQADPPDLDDSRSADWLRTVGAARARLQLPDGPDLAETLRLHRRRIEDQLCGRGESWSGNPARLALLLLALSAEVSYEATTAAAIAVAAREIIKLQKPSGGFAPRGRAKSRWSLPLARWGSGKADLQTTALCCGALAEVARQSFPPLADQAPVALARGLAWLLDRQAAAGCWAGPDGRPTVADTAAGLEALVASGARPASRGLRRAGLWLRSRQNRSGLWSDGDEISDHALTARVVGALIAARSAEIDLIERGVNALREPSAWNGAARPSARDLCDIAQGLAAFIEWHHDLPGTAGTRAASTRTAPRQSLSLHT
jgi:2-polyprenyl-6-methoxyphenol hydroxylase-like FAD-dependent oxidoreductase